MICGAPRRVGQLLLQQNVLGHHATLRQRAFDHQHEVIGIDGLGEKVERPFLHRGDGVLDAAVCRHHDDRQFRIQLFRRAQHAESIAFRQPQIRQHQRRPVVLHRAHRLALISGFDDHMAVAFDRKLQHHAQRVFVFDEQNGERHAARRSQRSQPAGTLARRASSSMSARALVCLAMSAFTRSCSAMAASRFCSMSAR